MLVLDRLRSVHPGATSRSTRSAGRSWRRSRLDSDYRLRTSRRPSAPLNPGPEPRAAGWPRSLKAASPRPWVTASGDVRFLVAHGLLKRTGPMCKLARAPVESHGVAAMVCGGLMQCRPQPARLPRALQWPETPGLATAHTHSFQNTLTETASETIQWQMSCR